jgi:DNA-binding NtrC family response regulator
MNKLSILVIDDEQLIRREIIDFLSAMDHYRLLEAATPAAAFAILENTTVDIALLDIRLPEQSGLQVLKEIKKLYPHIEVIMMTGNAEMELVIDAMRSGAFDFFTKPFDLLFLENALRRTQKFVEMQRRLQEVQVHNSWLSGHMMDAASPLIGDSAAMQEVMRLALAAARSRDTSVLITGESGVGKELIARLIHNQSERCQHPYLAVNCSAIPEHLLESEFFGHKKGAFTGAQSDKKGYFEAAHGGTLFLDEIGDMQPGLQGKLLRVLEERVIRPVGGLTDVAVDLRIIAATHQNLTAMVAEKKFRTDLLYRLNTVTVPIPPLRERKEDIALLLQHYTDYFCKKLKKNCNTIDKQTIDKLCAYPFPGNVRELKNLVERAVILNDGPALRDNDFPQLGAAVAITSTVANDSHEDLNLEEIEKRTILRALLKAGNNKSQAANLLHLSWSALDRRLKKYRIE